MTVLGALASNVEIDTGIADQTITSRKVDLTQSQVSVAAQETTTSTSYTDLATAGPAVTLTPGVTQDHLLLPSLYLRNSTTGQTAYANVGIAGAAPDAANEIRIDMAVGDTGARLGTQIVAATQSSGATHTVKYKVTANTGTYVARRLIGMCT